MTDTVQSSEPTSTWWAAGVGFNTDIFDVDTNTASEIVRELTTRLTEVDGAHHPYVDQRRLFFKFDPQQTSPEIMRAHMFQVINGIMAERETKSYFPLCSGSGPTVTYKVQVYKTRIPIN